MDRYTVVWTPSACRRLAELWLENPHIRQEIADAADEIDRALAVEPASVGISFSSRSRYVVRVPLTTLYILSEPDKLVRVIHVKHWTD